MLNFIIYSVHYYYFAQKLSNYSPKESDFQYTAADSNKKKNRQQKFLPRNNEYSIDFNTYCYG